MHRPDIGRHRQIGILAGQSTPQMMEPRDKQVHYHTMMSSAAVLPRPAHGTASCVPTAAQPGRGVGRQIKILGSSLPRQRPICQLLSDGKVASRFREDDKTYV